MVALVGMAFFAVLREGLETAVFLLAAFQSSTNPTAAGAGAVLGRRRRRAHRLGHLHAAACASTSPASSSFTAVVLVLVAAGLVAGAMHTAHEAGWLNVAPGPGARPHLARRPRHVDGVAADRHARPAAPADRRRGGRLPRSTRSRCGSTSCGRSGRGRGAPRAVSAAAGAHGAARRAARALAAGGSAACGDAAGDGAKGSRKVAIGSPTTAARRRRLKIAGRARPRSRSRTTGTAKVSEFEVLDGLAHHR